MFWKELKDMRLFILKSNAYKYIKNVKHEKGQPQIINIHKIKPPKKSTWNGMNL